MIVNECYKVSMKISIAMFCFVVTVFLFVPSSQVGAHDLDLKGMGYENISGFHATQGARIGLTENIGNEENDVVGDSINSESLGRTLIRFLWLGVEHIWFGYDHVLFLISGVLLLREKKKIISLVSGFTAAHSVTLLLSSFGVFRLPANIVEPIIAASIIYVVMQNVVALITNKVGSLNLKDRWLTTFGFGLIHGLGFAGALSEIAIPQKWFIPSLIIFNLGIELGQALILCVLMPILWVVGKTFWHKEINLLISIVCGAMAFGWFLERVLI